MYEILVICDFAEWVDVVGVHTLMPLSFKGEIESSHSCEQAHKLHMIEKMSATIVQPSDTVVLV